MERNVDLLHGRILPSLTSLAVPIMATAMVQTAYNLTDMAWVGRLGSSAVAAVGAAGMYTWLSSGLVAVARMGGQVKTSHAIGEGKLKEAGLFGAGALFIAVFFFQSSGNPQCWNLFMGLYALVSAPAVWVCAAGILENLEAGYCVGCVKEETNEGVSEKRAALNKKTTADLDGNCLDFVWLRLL